MNTAFHPKRLLDIAITLKRHISTASHDGFLNTIASNLPLYPHARSRPSISTASHERRLPS
eukprot:scaffold248477_cov83-Cyclotella_meneghiniana.AAC.1